MNAMIYQQSKNICLFLSSKPAVFGTGKKIFFLIIIFYIDLKTKISIDKLIGCSKPDLMYKQVMGNYPGSFNPPVAFFT